MPISEYASLEGSAVFTKIGEFYSALGIKRLSNGDAYKTYENKKIEIHI